MSDVSMSPLYTSTTLSSANLDLTFHPKLDEEHDDDDDDDEECLSPRKLYAQSFDRPKSAQSLPTGPIRKNMKAITMTGFGTTEEEFEALPIAVRRKVR